MELMDQKRDAGLWSAGLTRSIKTKRTKTARQRSAVLRSALSSTLMALALDREGSLALQAQIYQQIREIIVSGVARRGTKLPATRSLARDLNCSRNTVIAAFTRLLAEGYLESYVGSGTFVAQVLPEQYLRPDAAHKRSFKPGRGMELSERGLSIRRLAWSPCDRYSPFIPGLPDVLEFPFELWQRLHGNIWRQPSRNLVLHHDAAGLASLREMVADYLRVSRKVACEPDQVIITTGTQHGLDLTARLLLDAGDKVWVEDPGYTGLRGPLRSAGAELVPIPVDEEGLCLPVARKIAPSAKMAVVTPSHQFPLGSVMSLARRTALLDFAAENSMWIVEDDYDSEFRYSGNPIPALQGLDSGMRVIYVGTFSKTLFPAVRIGYLVVPKHLAQDFIAARSTFDVQPPISDQPVLAKFIADGHFASHTRRMRSIYARRHHALVASLRVTFGDDLSISSTGAGLHLIVTSRGRLLGRGDDESMIDRAAKRGLILQAVSNYCLKQKRAGEFLLGFGTVNETTIPRSVSTLRRALFDER
jgi:GntR family transcriptional regulator / MocR family aminotransferase